MQAIPVFDENGRAQSHCFQLGGQDDVPAAEIPKPSVEPAEVRPVAGAPARPREHREAWDVVINTRPLTTGAQTLSARELVRQLRARLKIVEREIRARKALEEERGQLQRLIAAARHESDNVRRIRSAG